MAWRDRLLPGSFRFARFHIQSHEAEAAGRRAHVHEYPGRDEPYAEDLGRRARGFEVEAYVVGPDYMLDRDALLAACDAAGPGTLVHPYLGTRRVLCIGCKVSESTRQGGMSRFSLTFAEAGRNRHPSSLLDTGAAAIEAADAAAAELARQFGATFAL